MATGTDDELVAECGTTESTGGTDLSERNNHVQMANYFTQFVQGSNVAPRLGQEILDDPARINNIIKPFKWVTKSSGHVAMDDSRDLYPWDNHHPRSKTNGREG